MQFILPFFRVFAAAVVLAVSPVSVANKGDALHQEQFAEHSFHHAAYHGDITEVNRLLATNADQNAANDDGNTALDVAKEKEHSEVVRILEESAAK